MNRKNPWLLTALALTLALAGAANLFAIDREAQDREFLRSLWTDGQAAPAEAGTKATCTATAQCGSTTVSCAGNSACFATDQNCSLGVRGHVQCDGVRTDCPVCPGGSPCGGDGVCNPRCLNIPDPDCYCRPARFCFDDSNCAPNGFCAPVGICYCP